MTKEQSRLLWQLQQVDRELKTLRTRHDEVPERLKELERVAAELRSGLETTRQAIVEQRKKYKLAEVELRASEEKAAGYSVQLYSAKTNEQYKAFLKEIEAQKRLKSEIEDRMIALMEELEDLERRARIAEKESAEAEADAGRKAAALEAERQELAAAIAEREKRRVEIAQQLPAELIRRYERVRASKGGVAVASVEGNRCNGCLSPIPPQRMLEIEREDRLFLCEACGRILVATQN
ncbi:MAG: hypothetical protein ABIK86_00010 [candidate division WOR-3 bacterium]